MPAIDLQRVKDQSRRFADGFTSGQKVMTVLGVADGRIETTSYGEEKPVAQGHDEQSWAQNRRADIKYAGE